MKKQRKKKNKSRRPVLDCTLLLDTLQVWQMKKFKTWNLGLFSIFSTIFIGNTFEVIFYTNYD